MKTQQNGFAFLLLGIILALSESSFFWAVGVFFGIVGLVTVLAGGRNGDG